MNAVPTLAALVLLASGCAAQPKLLRHYATLDGTPPAPASLSLSIFPVNVRPDDDPPLVAKLTERAQAALIAALAAKIPAKDGGTGLVTMLDTPTRPSPIACAWADRTMMKKRLVITLLGELAKPADRVDKVDITFALVPRTDGEAKPSGVDATFQSWDRFDSVYGTFNMGSATYTQSDKLSLGATRTGTGNLPNDAGSVVKALNFGYESNNTLGESVAYGMRRLSVGGALTATTARLVQEGGPNINLFGSSTATMTLRLTPTGRPAPVYAFTLEKDGKPATASTASVERCMSKFSRTGKDLMVDVSGTALVREVVTGDGTVSEGDDAARLRKVPLDGSRVVIVTSDELAEQRFGLADCSAGGSLANCKHLYIERALTGPSTGERVQVASIDEAAALRTWISDRSKTATIKSIGALKIGMVLRIPAQEVSVKSLTGITAVSADRLSIVRLGGNIE